MSKSTIIEDEYACLECECNTGTWLIHLTVHKGWTPSRYKEWKHIWERVKAGFRKQNITELYTIVDRQDETVKKFQRMWGFEPVLTFSDAVLYRQER